MKLRVLILVSVLSNAGVICMDNAENAMLDLVKGVRLQVMKSHPNIADSVLAQRYVDSVTVISGSDDIRVFFEDEQPFDRAVAVFSALAGVKRVDRLMDSKAASKR